MLVAVGTAVTKSVPRLRIKTFNPTGTHEESETLAVADANSAGMVNVAVRTVKLSVPLVPLPPFDPLFPLGPGMITGVQHGVKVAIDLVNDAHSVEIPGLVVQRAHG